MDLDWCLTCSQHTSGALYCSDECRREDISYSIKLTTSPTYSFYSKPVFSPLSPTFNYRPKPKIVSGSASTSSSNSPTPSLPTSQISAAILDEPQSQGSSYNSTSSENVIITSSQYTKIHPWMNQRRQQRRLSIII